MSRYGLILSKKQQQQKTAPKLSNVFGDDDASDEDDGTDWVRKALKAEGEKNKIKKQTKLDMEKALKEDPTIYQYDEVYDTIEHTKFKADINKPKQEKKPRYIENLLKTAERRKKEQEHRIERMVQKEREEEGEMYADKESFVTSAYKAKLEEFKKMEEEEENMSRLEAIGDVTKQQDMSGFYRHLYEQTVNHQDQSNDDESSKTKEKDVKTEKQKISANTADKVKKYVDEASTADETATAKHKKPRQYRQRAIETYESDSESEKSEEDVQQNQTFPPSINKDTDKSEIQEPEKKKRRHSANDVEVNKPITDTQNKDSSTKDDKTSQDSKNIVPENEKASTERKTVTKEDRSSIWKKRTIGPVFEAALQRYYARKAARLVAV